MFIHPSLHYNMKAHVKECILMMAHSAEGTVCNIGLQDCSSFLGQNIQGCVLVNEGAGFI